ncbi:hypothetical protein F4808DRAFT_461876 [Astrocystis sublimbata]|nr:hypothetical protein F4808DRAFT_461876 [Astrocystis sublimbata]
MDFKESLNLILENCVLISALGTQFLSNPWRPSKLKQLHAACTSFQAHMTEVYGEERRSLTSGKSADRNFMTSLVRLYAPVPTSKFVDRQSPVSFQVGDKTLALSPKTMLIPSYPSLQTDPKYRGHDSLEWRPPQFTKSADQTAADRSLIDAEELIAPARVTFLA